MAQTPLPQASTHTPDVMQISPAGQPPQNAPHVFSVPHLLLETLHGSPQSSGQVHLVSSPLHQVSPHHSTHAPPWQMRPPAQAPQSTPQAGSVPHSTAAHGEPQSAGQVHAVSPGSQESFPHFIAHAPASHSWPAGQVPQETPQTGSTPHASPAHGSPQSPAQLQEVSPLSASQSPSPQVGGQKPHASQESGQQSPARMQASLQPQLPPDAPHWQGEHP